MTSSLASFRKKAPSEQSPSIIPSSSSQHQLSQYQQQYHVEDESNMVTPDEELSSSDDVMESRLQNHKDMQDYTAKEHLRLWYYEAFPPEVRQKTAITFAVTVLILSIVALAAFPESRDAFTDIYTRNSRFRTYRINERALTYKEIFARQDAKSLAKFFGGEYYEERFRLMRQLNESREMLEYPPAEFPLDQTEAIFPHALDNVIDNIYIRTAQDNPLALIRATREAVQCYKNLGDLRQTIFRTGSDENSKDEGASAKPSRWSRLFHHSHRGGTEDGVAEADYTGDNRFRRHRNLALIRQLKDSCAGPTLSFTYRNRDVPFAQEKCKVLHPVRQEVPRLFERIMEWIASDPFQMGQNPLRDHPEQLIPAAAHLYYNVFMLRPFSREIEQEILFNYLLETVLHLPPISFGSHDEECLLLHDFRLHLQKHESTSNKFPLLYKFMSAKIEESHKYMTQKEQAPIEPEIQ